MKKINHIMHLLVVSGLIILISACTGQDGRDGRDGADGADGDVYIAYSWVGTLWAFWTDNPDIPTIVFNDTYYQTAAGTYSFSYQSWDFSIWNGNYTIVANEGEPGEPGEIGEKGSAFWQAGKDGRDGADGADGEDNYFLLGLWSTGPVIYNYTPGLSKEVPEIEIRNLLEAGHDASSTTEKFEWNEFDDSFYSPELKVSEVFHKEVRHGRYTLKLSYWRIAE